MARLVATLGDLEKAIKAARKEGATKDMEVHIELPTTFQIQDDGALAVNRETCVRVTDIGANYGYTEEGAFVITADPVDTAIAYSNATGKIPTDKEED